MTVKAWCESIWTPFLPENWEEMAIDERRTTSSMATILFGHRAKVQRQGREQHRNLVRVLSARSRPDIESKDSYAIAAIMERIENWEKTGERRSDHAYGRQRVYVRKTDDE
ncbi:MAG: hypothetical protein LKE66_10710 [Lachnospiraceae bacterium]|nr:hypothetical protein [Lachnospiraceae bacterium]